MEKTADKKFDESEIEPLSKSKSTESHGSPQYYVSGTKRALSQYCASGALSLLITAFGTSFGFSTILISELAELRKKDENFISLSQLTWLSSVNHFAIVFGALFSGILSQWMGRRNSLILSTFPIMASWIILHMCGEGQLWPIFLGISLLGLSGGLIESPLQVYVTEISEPKHRSAMSTSIGITIMMGFFLQMLLGKYIVWRTLALVNVSFPVVALIALALVPESPYWLASKGRYEESLKALAWLRGWSPVSQLPQDEFQDILSTVSKKTDKSLPAKRYFKRSTMVPFAIVSFAFLVSSLNGSTSILPWAILLFKEIHSPIDEHDAAIYLAAIQVAGTIAIMFLLPRFGKRKATLSSLAATGLSLFVVAAYTFFMQHSTESNWVSTIGVLAAIGFSFLGIKQIPWILTGELFSSDVRSQMAGILAGTCQVYGAIASKSFIYMKQAFTLSGTFLFFASVNFVGLVVLYYVLPETEGKSLAEIEQHFVDRRASKKKSSVADIATREL